jgi:hypothetical protein
MILHVEEARYLHDYVVWVRFNDGTAGEVDLCEELTGEVFGPLHDVSKFRQFRVDPDLSTIVWENGADLAPEFLRDRACSAASARRRDPRTRGRLRTSPSRL